MGILNIIFTKLKKNKLLYMSLFVGLVISTALISMIPMYTEGILTRIIRQQINTAQKNSNSYQGITTVQFDLSHSKINSEETLIGDSKDSYFEDPIINKFYKGAKNKFISQDKFIKENGQKYCVLPAIKDYRIYRTMQYELNNKDTGKDVGGVKLESVNDLKDTVKLTEGKLPSSQSADGVYDVIVSEKALMSYNMQVGRTYILKDKRNGGYEDIKVKISGVFKENTDNSYFWSNFNIENDFKDAFIMNEDLFYKDMINAENTRIESAQWCFVSDFSKIKISDLDNIVTNYDSFNQQILAINGDNKLSSRIISATQGYGDMRGKVSQIMLSINVSVVVMLFIYIFMIASLIMDREKNEISLLNSRGAKRGQIIAIYMMESAVLSVAAIIIGPLLGFVISRMLGATSGFMDFSNRWKLYSKISFDALLYSLYVIIVFNIIILITAFRSSKVTIVEQKKSKSRKNNKPFYQKYFLDLILFALSIYEYSSYLKQLNAAATVSQNNNFYVDPMLFLIPSLFTISLFMIFLRIHPYLIKLVFLIGKRIWSGETYATFLNMSRRSSRYHFIMIFLSLTISIGIYSGTIARSINNNTEDKIKCSDGADIVMTTKWDSNKVDVRVSLSGSSGDSSSEEASTTVQRDQYTEPPIDQFKALDGVESLCRVLKTPVKIKSVDANGLSDDFSLMAIDPYEFGRTAWSRSDMLSSHINNYLNLLTKYPTGCFITSNAASKFSLKAGDKISAYYDNLATCDLTIMGVVSSWPGYISSESSDEGMVIADIDYINDNLGLKPYDMWVKLKDGATAKNLKDSADKRNLRVIVNTNMKSDLDKSLTEPLRLAINSTMTLGFLISVLICVIGFVIFWIIFINSRILQFGIFRSMGIKTKNIFKTLLLEQIFTSGYAIISGLVIGIVTSKLFAPFIELALYGGKSSFPFKVIISGLDILKIMIVLIIMLVVILIALGYFVSKLKIGQAVKLGEE